MDDLSNKTLAMFLLAAMVVSLFGTFMVLNKVGTNLGPTGFATQGTGIVNLTVDSFLSITTNESSLIEFGDCTLNESRAVNITSMRTEDTVTYCEDYDTPSNISVRNNGNVVVNVSISSDTCAPGGGNETCAFLNNSALGYTENGLFQFMTTSAGRLGYTGGCGTPVAFTTINGTHGYRACTNLAADTIANSFVADFLLRLPRGLGTGTQTATLTFTASRP
jgi:hypothetical protein